MMRRSLGTSSLSVGGINGRSVSTLVAFLLAVGASFFIFDANVPTPVMLGLVALVFALVFWLLASAKLTFIGNDLVAGGGIYRVRVPLSKVVVEGVEALPETSPFRLRWRTNGLGWPGLSLGWFTTTRDKRVFAAVSSKQNRIYIPLHEKFDLVVSPVEPEKFLTELKLRTSSPSIELDR